VTEADDNTDSAYLRRLFHAAALLLLLLLLPLGALGDRQLHTRSLDHTTNTAGKSGCRRRRANPLYRQKSRPDERRSC